MERTTKGGLAMAAPKIRIEFEVGGRQYEAVSFLNEGEPSVDGDTMLARVPDAIGDEDEVFLSEHCVELPEFLRHYYLVTARRDPGGPRSVSCFRWSGRGWCQRWGWLGVRWGGGCLVVRRRT